MSLRDKFTDEEWNAIPPFTGFHHNNVKEELINKASDALRNCDNLDGLVFKKAKDKKSTEPNLFLLDEIGKMKIATPCYDSDSISRSYHDDEIGAFGKVNLWDFSCGMNKDIDITQIESSNYKFADNISVEEMLAERIKKENLPHDVIQNIVYKIHERKLSGKQCEVAIMSYSDYDALQSIEDFEIKAVWIAGCLLKTHASRNLQDGEIEIY